VEIIKNSIEEVLSSEVVDVIIIILLLRSLEVELHAFMDMIGVQPPARGSYLKEMLDVLTDLKNKTGKDIVAVFENRASLIKDVTVEKVSREMRSAYHARGIPVFLSAERALRGIRYVQKRRRAA